MPRRGWTIAVAGALLGGCARTPAAPAPAVRVDGSPGVMPLAAALGLAYEARHPGARVAMGAGLGTFARLAALAEGRIDVALASQGVDAAALAGQGLAAHEVAKAAVVFAALAAVGVSGLTSRQLCDAYAGLLTSWRALGGPAQPIAPRTRPPGEVDGDVATAGVPCLRDAASAGGVRAIERPEAMAEELATTPGALGMTSLPFVERSGGRLRALAREAGAPTADAVRAGRYPLVRRSLLLARAASPAHVARFLAFVRSAEGARVIAAGGAVPVR
ncbi:substrate-binding domain-containing protein [Roseisolibacter sp. H3M3-2]|uniref:substrate-binding domain-containing protein n=1 Tax=Roseisolibacter sp. H3M3-2 TaxID=3031323 RepID=UPI0023DC71C9|nr:substrate-binding domain-containing protein [Roseisolibacter sp. H3M3-2]MDF1505584.1 substrate-binding domain-containing protein [Roseisolibacter sp. H3M3-2]